MQFGFALELLISRYWNDRFFSYWIFTVKSANMISLDQLDIFRVFVNVLLYIRPSVHHRTCIFVIAKIDGCHELLHDAFHSVHLCWLVPVVPSSKPLSQALHSASSSVSAQWGFCVNVARVRILFVGFLPATFVCSVFGNWDEPMYIWSSNGIREDPA